MDSTESTFESLQTGFSRKLLGLPRCTSNTAICLQLGQSLVDTKVWQARFQCWRYVCFNAHPGSLIYQVLSDFMTPKWLIQIWEKVGSFLPGHPNDASGNLGS